MLKKYQTDSHVIYGTLRLEIFIKYPLITRESRLFAEIRKYYFMKCVYEELSEQECKCFCGGDKAMRSLGNSVGSIGASICNFLEYFGQMAQNSPTAYG